MEVLLVLIVIGGGAYWFFQGNVRRGGEIMRANIFLSALERGHSAVEANGDASRDMTELPPEFVFSANARATNQYRGVRLAMVSAAYQLGMHPKLPFWETSSIMSTYGNIEKVSSAGATQSASENATPVTAQPSGFDSYYGTYISELKRLAGIAPDELHRAELMEDEPLRRAFRDGVPPLELAMKHHIHDFGRQSI